MTDPIRVLIVDDHAMVRKGLLAILKNKPELELVGEARDGREAIECCEQLKPDVVLMDLVMPELGGVAATRAIHQRWPQVQVIALTSFQEKELVQDALQAGAIGYLLKNVSGDELAEAIRQAHGGRPTLAPEAVQALIQPPSEATSTGRRPDAAGAGGAGPAGERDEQPRNRRAPGHQPGHGQGARQQHPLQAGRRQPGGSHLAGDPEQAGPVDGAGAGCVEIQAGRSRDDENLEQTYRRIRPGRT